jgi:hypothetical protein
LYPYVKAVSRLITSSSTNLREREKNKTSNFDISLHLPKAKTELYTEIAGINKQRTSICSHRKREEIEKDMENKKQNEKDEDHQSRGKMGHLNYQTQLASLSPEEEAKNPPSSLPLQSASLILESH